MIVASIKEGFRITHQNLQLVLIRLVAAAINLFSIFIFLGIPVLAAVAYLGLDLAAAEEIVPAFLQNPFELISRYLGLIILIGVSFLCYLAFASFLILYVLSGSLGVLRNAAVNIRYKFELSSFFREANGNVIRLLWILTLVSLMLGGLLIAYLMIAGAAGAAVHSFSGSGSTAELFFRSFIVVSAVVLGGLVFLAAFVCAVFSLVASVVDRTGTMDSIKNAARLLREIPGAIFYCILLFISAMVLNIVVFGLKIPFNVLPVIGPALVILLSVISAFFQSYLAVVVWACLVAYYVKATDRPVYTASYEI